MLEVGKSNVEPIHPSISKPLYPIEIHGNVEPGERSVVVKICLCNAREPADHPEWVPASRPVFLEQPPDPPSRIKCLPEMNE